MAAKSTIDTSGHGNFYIEGEDVPFVAAALEEWLEKLEKGHKIKIKSFHFSYNAKAIEVKAVDK